MSVTEEQEGLGPSRRQSTQEEPLQAGSLEAGPSAAPRRSPVPSEITETRAPLMRNASPWQRSHAVWQAAGIDWAHTGTSTGSQEPAPGGTGSRRRMPRLGRAVPIALVVLLVAGGGTYLLRGGLPSGDEKHTPKKPVAVAADQIFALDQAAATDGQVQELSGVAAAGSTVVAIGSEQGDSSRSRFVSSVDGGRTWRLGQVRTADGDEPAPGQVPTWIAGGPAGWLALGGTAVWTSRDGHAWTRRVDVPVSIFGPSDHVYGLASTASGFVAVGVGGPAGKTRGVVWTTTDGGAWQRTGTDQLKLGTVLAINGVAANGNTLIAHGTVARNVTRKVKKKGKKAKVSNPVASAAFWRSADGGRSWTAATVPQPPGALATPVRLVSGPGGFFAAWEVARAVGAKKHRKTTRSAVVLSSLDGRTWSETGQIAQPDYAGLEQFGGSDTGLSAVLKTTNGKPAVLHSGNGGTWQRLGGTPLSADLAKSLTGLAVLPSATVVVGHQGAGDAYLSALGGAGDIDLTKIPGMVHPDHTITALAMSGSQIVAVGSGSGDAAVWSTQDGKTWQRALTPRGTASRRLSAVVHGPQGWVAVGYSGGGSGSVGTAPRLPLVMTSADGATWRTATGFPGAVGAVPSSVTYGPAGYVAVGQAGGKMAAWWSADLKTWHRAVGDPVGGRWMSGVTVTSAGYVAVGGRQVNANTVQPAAWTSTDGKKWTAAAAPSLPAGATAGSFTGSFTQVLARDEVLVAAGSATVGSQSQVLSAVSADGGHTWQPQLLPGGGQFTAATLTPKGFLVAAMAGAPGRTDVALSTSADGRTWSQSKPKGNGLDGRGAQRLTAMTTIDAGLLAVGVNGDSLGDTITLWRTLVP